MTTARTQAYRVAACAALSGAILVAAGVSPVAAAASPLTAVQQGERFYRLGVGANGAPVKATVEGDIVVSSGTMPCANCHRRSGWGTIEGSVTTPPIAGAFLFSPTTLGASQMRLRTTGAGTRPAYDDITLARALRDGVDSAGRALSLTMPRYAVTPADVGSLAAYLRELSAAPAPGVSDTTIHLATIVSDQSDPRQRAAVLNVLRAFVQAKDAGTRHEAARRDRGGFDMKDQQGAYRRWELHEWTVSGPPRDWPAQLDAAYARQPVFAVVSGAVSGDWAPIHRFCEARQVPCLFPETPLPFHAPTDEGFYTLYLSPGVSGEAAALTHYLTAADHAGDVVQVLRCGGAADGVARGVTAALPATKGASSIRTVCLQASEPFTESRWRVIVGHASAVVAWLDADDLAGLASIAGSVEGVHAIYLSASLLGDRVTELAALWPKAYLLSPFVAPDELDRQSARAMVWMKSRAIEIPDRAAAVNALFAASLVAETLTLPRALLSREYFIEQIEHMVGRSPLSTPYPSVSLGPVQRFASLGSYVLKMPPVPGGTFEKVGPWYIPETRVKESK